MCLTKFHAMKMYQGWGEWSASHPGCFTPGKDPGTLWIGGWVGPKAGQEVVVKKKVPAPARNEALVIHPIT